MLSTNKTKMGKVTTTIAVTNHVDEILAERGFMDSAQVRSVSFHEVLIDTRLTHLGLPAETIAQLGLSLKEDREANTAVGKRRFRVFKDLTLFVEGREGRYDCVELPDGTTPAIGFLPLQDLGLEPDLENQRFIVLPDRGKESYIRV